MDFNLDAFLGKIGLRQRQNGIAPIVTHAEIPAKKHRGKDKVQRVLQALRNESDIPLNAPQYATKVARLQRAKVRQTAIMNNLIQQKKAGFHPPTADVSLINQYLPAVSTSLDGLLAVGKVDKDKAGKRMTTVESQVRNKERTRKKNYLPSFAFRRPSRMVSARARGTS